MQGILKNEKGYIVSIVTFFVLVIMFGMAMSMSFLTAERQRGITNTVLSTQSYYAAEAGVEDALLKLKDNPTISSLSYNFDINNTSVSINIPNTVGASKTITSQSNNNGMQRNIEAICSETNGGEASFYYGVEVGHGGLVMMNGSEVVGNVFSGGDISGSGTIDNNVVVSGNGHSVKDVYVKGNVLAYSCLSSAQVDGDLTYVTGGSHTCTVNGNTNVQSEEISEQPLPIPQSQIDEWKNQAAVNTVSGNVVIATDQSLGPEKITGNLTVNGGVTLTITGGIYVLGTVTFQNGVTVELDSSYGIAGGFIIADGAISINNNDVFSGSGQEGSYVMLISTSASDTAIDIKNNAQGVVLYTNNGGITVHNNVLVTEATGYKVILQNNAKIQYSTGIVNIYFSSGPGGSWEVDSWQEY